VNEAMDKALVPFSGGQDHRKADADATTRAAGANGAERTVPENDRDRRASVSA
jgi:hypothetical protein